MKKVLALAMVLAGMSVATMSLVGLAQNDNLIMVTRQDVGEYKGFIEFDLREHPTPATMFQFTLMMQKKVCSINYKAPTARLNGKELGLILASDEKSFEYRGRMTTDLLKIRGNQLRLDAGSCKTGDHKLSMVKALTVETTTSPHTSQSQ